MNLLFLWENNNSMIKVLIVAVLLGLVSVAHSQIIPADKIYCDSIVKADTNYVKYYHDKKYYSNGNLKGEALILRKRKNLHFDVDVPVGRITQYYRNGQIEMVYYYNHNGLSCGADSFYFSSGVLGKVILHDSINTYYFKQKHRADSYRPDNFLEKKFYSNGNLKSHGRIFYIEKNLHQKRRGKWIFYNKDGVVRKVKYY